MVLKINIQIGGTPHKDGEIDNPEFYYQAMNIVNQHRAKSEQAVRERELESKRNKQKSEPNILIWVIAVIIVCLMCIR